MQKVRKLLEVLYRNHPKDLVRYFLIFLHYISAKLLVQFVPLRYYLKRFNQKEMIAIDDMQLYFSQIGQFNRIKKYIPWHVTCLMESLAMQSYFKRYKFDMPIYLGVKVEEGTFQAHAWVFSEYENGFSQIEIKYE